MMLEIRDVKKSFGGLTVLDGIKVFASRVAYAKGCGIRSKKTDGFAEALRVAADAAVPVLVLGGRSWP